MPIDFDGLCPPLKVFDMRTSVKFYCEVLGFELTGNSPIMHGRDGNYFHWCMFRRGGITIMLNTLMTKASALPRRTPLALPCTTTPRSSSAAPTRTPPSINFFLSVSTFWRSPTPPCTTCAGSRSPTPTATTSLFRGLYRRNNFCICLFLR